MEEKSLDSIELGRIRRMMSRVEEFPDESQVTFEFLIGSFFPKIMEKIENKLKEEHTKGYIEGRSEYLENKGVYKLKMQGTVKDFDKVLEDLNKAKESINSCSWGLSDAGFHGWSGEPLKQEWSTVIALEGKVKESIEICEKALGINE